MPYTRFLLYLRSVGAGAVGDAPLGPQEVILQLATVGVAGGVVEVVTGAGVPAEPRHGMRAAPVSLHLAAPAVRHEPRLQVDAGRVEGAPGRPHPVHGLDARVRRLVHGPVAILQKSPGKFLSKLMIR